eukprot:g1001.t1
MNKVSSSCSSLQLSTDRERVRIPSTSSAFALRVQAQEGQLHEPTLRELATEAERELELEFLPPNANNEERATPVKGGLLTYLEELHPGVENGGKNHLSATAAGQSGSLQGTSLRGLDAQRERGDEPSSAFALRVQAQLQQIKPTLHYWQSSDEVIARIQQFCRSAFYNETVDVRPFGSYAQRTALLGSDVDIALIFRERCTRGAAGGYYDDPTRLKGFDDDVHDKDRALKNEKIQILKTLASDLRKDYRQFRGDCKVVDQVWFAKIPLLKIEFDSVLETDISVGKSTTGTADERIRELFEQAGEEQRERLVNGYLIVKYWVKQRASRVPDKTPAFHGLLNSYSWVLLYLFFAIEKGFIHSYEERKVYFSGKKRRSCVEGGSRGDRGRGENEENAGRRTNDTYLEEVMERVGGPSCSSQQRAGTTRKRAAAGEEDGDEDADQDDDANTHARTLAKRRKVEGPNIGENAGSKSSSDVFDGVINLDSDGESEGETCSQEIPIPPEHVLFRQFLLFLHNLSPESTDPTALRTTKIAVRTGRREACVLGDFQAEALWVEDPFEPTNNAARSVRTAGWRIVCWEVARAVGLLEAAASSDGSGRDLEEEADPFDTIFAPREISQPEIDGRVAPGGVRNHAAALSSTLGGKGARAFGGASRQGKPGLGQQQDSGRPNNRFDRDLRGQQGSSGHAGSGLLRGGLDSEEYRQGVQASQWGGGAGERNSGPLRPLPKAWHPEKTIQSKENDFVTARVRKRTTIGRWMASTRRGRYGAALPLPPPDNDGTNFWGETPNGFVKGLLGDDIEERLLMNWEGQLHEPTLRELASEAERELELEFLPPNANNEQRATPVKGGLLTSTRPTHLPKSLYGNPVNPQAHPQMGRMNLPLPVESSVKRLQSEFGLLRKNLPSFFLDHMAKIELAAGIALREAVRQLDVRTESLQKLYEDKLRASAEEMRAKERRLVEFEKREADLLEAVTDLGGKLFSKEQRIAELEQGIEERLGVGSKAEDGQVIAELQSKLEQARRELDLVYLRQNGRILTDAPPPKNENDVDENNMNKFEYLKQKMAELLQEHVGLLKATVKKDPSEVDPGLLQRGITANARAQMALHQEELRPIAVDRELEDWLLTGAARRQDNGEGTMSRGESPVEKGIGNNYTDKKDLSDLEDVAQTLKHAEEALLRKLEVGGGKSFELLGGGGNGAREKDTISEKMYDVGTQIDDLLAVLEHYLQGLPPNEVPLAIFTDIAEEIYAPPEKDGNHDTSGSPDPLDRILDRYSQLPGNEGLDTRVKKSSIEKRGGRGFSRNGGNGVSRSFDLRLRDLLIVGQDPGLVLKLVQLCEWQRVVSEIHSHVCRKYLRVAERKAKRLEKQAEREAADHYRELKTQESFFQQALAKAVAAGQAVKVGAFAIEAEIDEEGSGSEDTGENEDPGSLKGRFKGEVRLGDHQMASKDSSLKEDIEDIEDVLTTGANSAARKNELRDEVEALRQLKEQLHNPESSAAGGSTSKSLGKKGGKKHRRGKEARAPKLATNTFDDTTHTDLRASVARLELGLVTGKDALADDGPLLQSGPGPRGGRSKKQADAPVEALRRQYENQLEVLREQNAGLIRRLQSRGDFFSAVPRTGETAREENPHDLESLSFLRRLLQAKRSELAEDGEILPKKQQFQHLQDDSEWLGEIESAVNEEIARLRSQINRSWAAAGEWRQKCQELAAMIRGELNPSLVLPDEAREKVKALNAENCFLNEENEMLEKRVRELEKELRASRGGSRGGSPGDDVTELRSPDDGRRLSPVIRPTGVVQRRGQSEIRAAAMVGDMEDPARISKVLKNLRKENQVLHAVATQMSLRGSADASAAVRATDASETVDAALQPSWRLSVASRVTSPAERAGAAAQQLQQQNELLTIENELMAKRVEDLEKENASAKRRVEQLEAGLPVSPNASAQKLGRSPSVVVVQPPYAADEDDTGKVEGESKTGAIVPARGGSSSTPKQGVTGKITDLAVDYGSYDTGNEAVHPSQRGRELSQFRKAAKTPADEEREVVGNAADASVAVMHSPILGDHREDRGERETQTTAAKYETRIKVLQEKLERANARADELDLANGADDGAFKELTREKNNLKAKMSLLHTQVMHLRETARAVADETNAIVFGRNSRKGKRKADDLATRYSASVDERAGAAAGSASAANRRAGSVLTRSSKSPSDRGGRAPSKSSRRSSNNSPTNNNSPTSHNYGQHPPTFTAQETMIRDAQYALREVQDCNEELKYWQADKLLTDPDWKAKIQQGYDDRISSAQEKNVKLHNDLKRVTALRDKLDRENADLKTKVWEMGNDILLLNQKLKGGMLPISERGAAGPGAGPRSQSLFNYDRNGRRTTTATARKVSTSPKRSSDNLVDKDEAELRVKKITDKYQRQIRRLEDLLEEALQQAPQYNKLPSVAGGGVLEKSKADVVLIEQLRQYEKEIADLQEASLDWAKKERPSLVKDAEDLRQRLLDVDAEWREKFFALQREANDLKANVVPELELSLQQAQAENEANRKLKFERDEAKSHEEHLMRQLAELRETFKSLEGEEGQMRDALRRAEVEKDRQVWDATRRLQAVTTELEQRSAQLDAARAEIGNLKEKASDAAERFSGEVKGMDEELRGLQRQFAEKCGENDALVAQVRSLSEQRESDELRMRDALRKSTLVAAKQEEAMANLQAREEQLREQLSAMRDAKTEAESVVVPKLQADLQQRERELAAATAQIEKLLDTFQRESKREASDREKARKMAEELAQTKAQLRDATQRADGETQKLQFEVQLRERELAATKAQMEKLLADLASGRKGEDDKRKSDDTAKVKSEADFERLKFDLAQQKHKLETDLEKALLELKLKEEDLADARAHIEQLVRSFGNEKRKEAGRRLSRASGEITGAERETGALSVADLEKQKHDLLSEAKEKESVLREKLHAMRDAKVQAEAENGKLRFQLQMLEQDLLEARRQTEKLIESFKSERRGEESERRRGEELERARAELENALSAAREGKARAEAECDRVYHDLALRERDLEAARAQTEKLLDGAQVDRADRELSRRKDSDFENLRAELTEKLHALREQKAKAEAELERVQLQLSMRDRDLEAAKAQIESLLQDSKANLAKRDDDERARAAAERVKQDLTEKLHRMREQKAQAEAAVEKLQLELKMKSRDLLEAKSHIENLLGKIPREDPQKGGFRSDAQENRGREADENKNLNLERLQFELATRDRDLADAKGHCELLQLEIDRLRQECQATIDRYENDPRLSSPANSEHRALSTARSLTRTLASRTTRAADARNDVQHGGGVTTFELRGLSAVAEDQADAPDDSERVASLRENLNVLLKENNELKLAQADKRVTESAGMNAKLKRIRELEAELKDGEGVRKLLERDLRDAQGQIELLQGDINRMRKELEAHIKKADTTTKGGSEDGEEASSLKKKIRELKGVVKGKNVTIKKLSELTRMLMSNAEALNDNDLRQTQFPRPDLPVPDKGPDNSRLGGENYTSASTSRFLATQKSLGTQKTAGRLAGGDRLSPAALREVDFTLSGVLSKDSTLERGRSGEGDSGNRDSRGFEMIGGLDLAGTSGEGTE